MRSSVRIKIEVVMARISAALAVLTLAVPAWLEEVFGLDPDGGTGETEWSIVAAFAAVSAVLFLVAFVERRRAAKRLAG